MRTILSIYINELKACATDLGVMVFFVLVPLGYPLLYTYIYSQEVVRDIPVAAVDMSHTPVSRKFLSNADATPEIAITRHCTSIDEARILIGQNKVRGIIYVPQEFSHNLQRDEQAHISIYCNMASLFYYKAILVSCTKVSLAMNREIQIKKMNGYTAREESISTTPITATAIGISNPVTGFADFVIPAILVLILQQTMLLGIGMRMGTEHEKIAGTWCKQQTHNTLALLTGRTAAYFTIYVPITAYTLCVVPALFGLSQLAQPATLAVFMLPYLLAAIFIAITTGSIIRERETPMLLFVFTSVPFLFLSGISWPGSAIPTFWKAISYLLPSTPAINGFVSINQTGATLTDVTAEYHLLWLQACVYAFTAYFVLHNRSCRQHP